MKSQLRMQARVIQMPVPDESGPLDAIALFNADGTLYLPEGTGLPGPEGPAGPIGLTGEMGPTGAQGVIGPTGATGAQGPAGTPGTIIDMRKVRYSVSIPGNATSDVTVPFATPFSDISYTVSCAYEIPTPGGLGNITLRRIVSRQVDGVTMKVQNSSLTDAIVIWIHLIAIHD